MKFTDATIDRINNKLLDKKKANPVSSTEAGIGIFIGNGLHGSSAIRNNTVICTLEDLDRTIEELTMLKEAIEEETGIIL